jgi:hypothetical protein
VRTGKGNDPATPDRGLFAGGVNRAFQAQFNPEQRRFGRDEFRCIFIIYWDFIVFYLRFITLNAGRKPQACEPEKEMIPQRLIEDCSLAA